MTQEEIIEYNKRCAEFLGYIFDDLSETYETLHLKLVDPQAFGDEQFNCKLKDFELDFHSDWNWIMEVVEAILKLPNIKPQGDTTQQSKTIAIQAYLGKAKKQATIEAINQFLTWYKINSNESN